MRKLKSPTAVGIIQICTKDVETQEYQDFFKEIISNIENAKINASQQITAILVELNFRNGKSIVEKQEKYGWGSSIIKQLSVDLNKFMTDCKDIQFQIAIYASILS